MRLGKTIWLKEKTKAAAQTDKQSTKRTNSSQVKDIKIIVAAHKKALMPSDSCYLPLHVGSEGKEPIGFTGDNTGDNISAKNPSFCELTGVYWAWKNLKADYVGLVHYRRIFAKHYSPTLKGKRNQILTGQDYEHILSEYDVILPKKRHYYLETSRSQYEHAHNPSDLTIVEQIIEQRHPESVEAFRKVMGRTSGHRFNMFVMRRDLFNDYCEWMFDILMELERRIDISAYNSYNKRVFGFIGERLLDVWIETRHVRYAEQRVLFLERQNWLKKIFKFIGRKIAGGSNFTKK